MFSQVPGLINSTSTTATPNESSASTSQTLGIPNAAATLSVLTSSQEQAVPSSRSALAKDSTESDKARADSTHAPATKDLQTKLYLPVASFQQLIGTDVAHVIISGGSETELDVACHKTCAENKACEFWVRRAGTGGNKSCWLKKEAIGSPVNDATVRGGFKATRIVQPLDLGALRSKNLLIAGDSNDRNFVTNICEWMRVQGLHTELVHATTLHISNHSTEDVFLPAHAQPRICHVKSLDASIASAFHYGAATIAPASSIHTQFMTDRPDHMPYQKVFRNFEQVNKPMFPSSDHISKVLWPTLVKDYLPRRPVHVVAQSSLWDSLPVVLDVLETHNGPASSIEAPEFARTFMAGYNWTEKASMFVAAIRSSFDAKQIIWRTTPGCPFGTPINKISELQREAVIQKIASGVSPWEGVHLLDWAASFSVRGGTDCDSEGIHGVHYKPEGYWAFFEQLVLVLSGKQ